MDTGAYVIAIVLVVPAFFLWSAIHELSHYLMARAFRRVTWVSFKIYPHTHQITGFRWASVVWNYEGPDITSREQAAISSAPRIPDLLASIALPIGAWFIEGTWLGVWLVLLGGGLVDLAVGSIGANKYTDLQRCAVGIGVSPWLLRVIGWSVVVVVASVTIAGVIL